VRLSVVVNLFVFEDYRAFLRAYYVEQKNRNKGFSFRLFARHAGLASPNYLKLVIEGNRRITDKSLPNFVKGLRLSKEEEGYFKALVAYQEAKDTDTRENSKDELARLRARNLKRVAELEETRADYLKHWYHLAVRELVTLDGFKPCPAWISSMLRHRITEEQAKESLELLLKLGFVKVQHGVYVLAEPLLTSGDEISNRRVAGLIQNIHRQMSDLAMKTMEEEAKEWRELNGLTLAVPLSKVPEIKNAIKRFSRELNQTFSSEEANEAVYYLAVQFFPLTTLGERREK
jgi:uncharacterized protein (TIGR02147 family)